MINGGRSVSCVSPFACKIKHKCPGYPAKQMSESPQAKTHPMSSYKDVCAVLLLRRYVSKNVPWKNAKSRPVLFLSIVACRRLSPQQKMYINGGSFTTRQLSPRFWDLLASQSSAVPWWIIAPPSGIIFSYTFTTCITPQPQFWTITSAHNWCVIRGSFKGWQVLPLIF